jgi:uncharacterized protein (DUF2062 family)
MSAIVINTRIIKTIWTRIKGVTVKLLSIRGKPLDVAKGYALGIFLATTPFIGLKVFIALLLSALFRWNKTASVIGVYHVNPLTAPPFYALAFLVGKTFLGIKESFVFPDDLRITSLFHIFTGAGNIFLCLLAGGLILGIPLTCLAFLSVRTVLIRQQR